MERRGPAVSAPLAQLPNAITIARFLMIPAFVALMVAHDGRSWPAAILFGAAGASDQVDGFLARRWRVESEFGKYADPLADRLMIDVAIILLVVYDRLAWPALAIILLRDVVLVAGSRWAVARGYEFEVSSLGKLATWVLYAGVAFTIAMRDVWPRVLFWVGLGLAVLAGALYVASAARAISRR
jgi:CDP-diacylglycerol--glycerol-3-phosphate 3-phosphatidyltransferase